MSQTKQALDKKEFQKKLRPYLIYSAMAIAGVSILYFIFKPQKQDMHQRKMKTELPEPAPEVGQMPETKEDAYEDYAVSIHHQIKSLEGFSYDLKPEPKKEEKQNIHPSNAFENANDALFRLNKIVETGTSQTEQNNPSYEEKIREMERALLQKENELQMLSAQNEFQKIIASNTPEQNQLRSLTPSSQEDQSTQITVKPVKEIFQEPISTLLKQNHFFSIENKEGQNKNTIAAEIYGEQILSNGQYIRIRLKEPLSISSQILPRGSILCAIAQVGIDRLYASIEYIEYKGVLHTVNIELFDIDGQRGLALCGSMELESIKEMGGEIANAVGSSSSQSISVFSQQPSAAEQLKVDVAKGFIQGASRHIGKKLQQIKVRLQDGHRLLLLPK